MTVETTVGQRRGEIVVQLRGELKLADVAELRLRLNKCLAEHPDALLVDLAGLRVIEPLALSVFVAVARQAARWPGTPVLLCAPTDETRGLLSAAAYRRLPLFRDVAAAHRQVGREQRSLPVIIEDLLPISGAARQARNVATDACLRWDLPHLVAPASLITSELVSNVVDHAHTMMSLRLSLWERHLTIAVRDGSSAEPVRPHRTAPDATAPDTAGGRGLFLVAATALNWGWLPTDDGKVVWASLSRSSSAE